MLWVGYVYTPSYSLLTVTRRCFWCSSLFRVLVSEFRWYFKLCLFIILFVRFGLLSDHLLGNSCSLGLRFFLIVFCLIVILVWERVLSFDCLQFLFRDFILLLNPADIACIKWASFWENRSFGYAKTKPQISSCAVTAQLISGFVFATWIEQSLFFLNPKFRASRHPLWLHSPVCVGPDRKPEDRFSQNEAQIGVDKGPTKIRHLKLVACSCYRVRKLNYLALKQVACWNNHFHP